MKTLKTLAAALALTACAVGPVHAATASNGLSLNGLSLNGLSLNGMRTNGFKLNGFKMNGFKMNGFKMNGGAVHGSASHVAGLQAVAVTLPGEWSEHAATTKAPPSIKSCPVRNACDLPDPNGRSLDGFAEIRATGQALAH